MRRRIACFALLLTFLPAIAHAQKDDATARAWNQPVPPVRIADNLYYVGAANVSSFLFTSPQGHILLDGGFEETAPLILASIKKLGFKPRDVRILIASHPHYDHAAGLEALQRATGAKFYSSALDAPAFASGGKDDPQFGDRFPFPPIVADRKFGDGEQVKLGGLVLTAHITAGHTRGCTSWTFGEAVILCSPTSPGYQLVGNPKYPNAVEDYRRQFAFLRALRPKIFLAAHGDFFDLQRKVKIGTPEAFVDPEGYRKFVEEAEKAFEEKVAAQTIAARKK